MSSRAKPKNASPGRKARGKPFVVGNTSGRGRPKGSLNKTTLLCQELLAEGAEAVTKKVVQLAKKGDPAAMQIVMQRVCPARPGVAVQMNMKPITCADDLPVAYASALDVVNTGRLTLVEGQQYLSILDRVAKTLQFVFGRLGSRTTGRLSRPLSRPGRRRQQLPKKTPTMKIRRSTTTRKIRRSRKASPTSRDSAPGNRRVCVISALS